MSPWVGCLCMLFIGKRSNDNILADWERSEPGCWRTDLDCRCIIQCCRCQAIIAVGVFLGVALCDVAYRAYRLTQCSAK